MWYNINIQIVRGVLSMEWRKIADKNTYSVSENGDIRNDKTGRILKQRTGTSGYNQIMLGRKTIPLYVHRIVAKAFIPNPNNYPQVDHINGNKLDNRVQNLRWVTASENALGFGYSNRIENKKKCIIATKGEEILHFKSRDETAKYFKCHKSQIKYGWEYKKGNKKGWTFLLDKDIV